LTAISNEALHSATRNWIRRRIINVPKRQLLNTFCKSVITDMSLMNVCDVTLQRSTERAPYKPSPHTKETKRQRCITKTREDIRLRTACYRLQDRVTCCGNIIIRDVGLSRGPGRLSQYSYLLRAGRPGDRILVWVRFSAPVQTGSGAHPASYTMGTGSLSRG
jgi:hypothetical protein